MKHLLWLIKQMIVCFLKGDFNGSLEAIFWIRIHLTYEFKKIK